MDAIDNKVAYIFFNLLKAGLWGKDARISQFGPIDYAALMQLAEEQSVVGLITAGLEHVIDVQIPKEWTLRFIGNTLQLEQRNRAMNAFISDLIAKMRETGIYTLLVKGQGIARCYDKPSWRACGDVDLFLSDDNYEKAKAFLRPFASTVEEEYKREKHFGMTIDGWVLELHGRLYSGLSSRIERELDEVLKDSFYGGLVRSWNCEGVQVFLLKEENDIFYVFTHILQHFYKEGVGLRQICDWSRLLWYYRKRIDLRMLEGRIKRAGLMTAWKAFGAYAVVFLGMPVEAMPFYSENKCWKRKAKRINKFILSVGNMGHNRDISYYSKYPYMIRKAISFGRRCGDLWRHTRIFPFDSLKFFPSIIVNGLRSAARGE